MASGIAPAPAKDECAEPPQSPMDIAPGGQALPNHAKRRQGRCTFLQAQHPQSCKHGSPVKGPLE